MSPPFSPPSSESATPGKSNLKQTSQFENPPAEPATSGSNDLPEIPTIEVHPVSEVQETAEEDSKGTKVAGKGVRFADLEEHQAKENDQQTAVQSNSVDVSDVSVILKKEEEKTEGEAIGMESVDFDKVTGTSTPISDDSPSLPVKHNASVDGNGQAFMTSTSFDSEDEDQEEVIEATENTPETGATDNPSDSHTVEETDIQGSLGQSTDQS